MSNIRTELENGVLTLLASGRIDSTSAPEAEKEIISACTGTAHSEVVLDAEELEYISSAGLRVILRLRKSEPTLRVINASSEV